MSEQVPWHREGRPDYLRRTIRLIPPPTPASWHTYPTWISVAHHISYGTGHQLRVMFIYVRRVAIKRGERRVAVI